MSGYDNSVSALTYTVYGSTTWSPAAWQPTIVNPSWYFQPRTIERRKRSFALPVAIGHAVFFLALALAGWLR